MHVKKPPQDNTTKARGAHLFKKLRLDLALALLGMAKSKLAVEEILEELTLLENRIVIGPILIAVLEDQANIGLKLTTGSVLVVCHLSVNGRQIHWALDDVEVVGAVVSDWIDWLAERFDIAGPVGWGGEHTANE